MSSKILPSLIAFTFVALALPVVAQVAVTQPKQPCKCTQQPHPYTAEFKSTQVQTLVSGATITHASTEIAAVDSSGRAMGSTTQERPELEIGQWTHGHMHDPVASTETNWDSNSHKATVIKYPAKEEQHGCWANEAGSFRVSYGGEHPASGSVQRPPAARAQVQHPQQNTEDLGTTTIQGVEATGRRTTTTIPAGQVGNDQPIVTTQETWWSKGIGVGLLLRSISDDPRSGTTTREVTNLSLGEPDPVLFQPPEGYEVKTDELHQVVCAQ